MSKSKGNVLDPLGLIEEFGADALRFTLTAMSGQARDIRLSRQRIEGYRNLGTKLWNAARFCEMNGCVSVEGFDPGAASLTINRWIRSETVLVSNRVTTALENCAFDDAANALYRFIWNIFCDWFVEFAKPILGGDDEAAKSETRGMAAWVLETIVKLLHPIMPFVTEALWADTAPQGRPRETLLITAPWPVTPDSWRDPGASEEIDLVIAAVTEGRSMRAELNVPPGARPDFIVLDAGDNQRRTLAANAGVIAHTLRSGPLRFEAALPHGAVPFVVSGTTFALVVSGLVDVPAERVRLTKEIAAQAADIDRTARKLASADFINRAPPEVVEENRARLTDAELTRARLDTLLARLATL